MLNEANQVESGKPEQFCTAMAGQANDSPLSVSAYPAAWRIEIVNDDIHRGFEYVRSEHNTTRVPERSLTLYVSFYWGTTTMIWNIPYGTSTDVRVEPYRRETTTKRFHLGQFLDG
jgi:hypothetical protein